MLHFLFRFCPQTGRIRGEHCHYGIIAKDLAKGGIGHHSGQPVVHLIITVDVLGGSTKLAQYSVYGRLGQKLAQA